MIVDVQGLAELRGTSPEKVGAVLAQVRSVPAASMALWMLEKMPGDFGNAVKALLYDVPRMPAPALDAAINAMAEQLLLLLSDAHTLDVIDPDQLALPTPTEETPTT
jgi:hypothetical protein